jgi:hypothetical protein
VGAFGEELLQALRCLRDRVWPSDADDVEAALDSRAHERGLERGGIIQKSRSA